MSEQKLIITDSKRIQLLKLKESLEDLELYLRQIEETLNLAETAPDEKAKQKYKLEMAMIQQRILDISNMLAQDSMPGKAN